MKMKRLQEKKLSIEQLRPSGKLRIYKDTYIEIQNTLINDLGFMPADLKTVSISTVGRMYPVIIFNACWPLPPRFSKCLWVKRYKSRSYISQLYCTKTCREVLRKLKVLEPYNDSYEFRLVASLVDSTSFRWMYYIVPF